MGRTIGIDLGNTKLYMAALDDGDPMMIASAEGFFAIPAVAGIDRGSNLRLGHSANRLRIINSENTIFNFLQFVGMNQQTLERRVQAGISPNPQNLPYRMTFTRQGIPQLRMGEKEYTPVKILTLLLGKLRQDAQVFLDDEVSGAVIAVPDGLSDPAWAAVMEAAERARFTSSQIITHSTAVLHGYGADLDRDRLIAVVHMGGATSRITLVQTGDGTTRDLLTAEDPALGGMAATNRIIAAIANQFESDHGVELRMDPMAMQNLFEWCEDALISLAEKPEVRINLPFIAANDTGPLHLDTIITRATLIDLLAPLLDDFTDLIEQTLQRAEEKHHLSLADMDHVVLTGGMMFHPVLQARVAAIMGQEPLIEAQPDMVVAAGAALASGKTETSAPLSLQEQVARLNTGIAKILTQPDDTPATARHVFISYSRANTTIMQLVADALTDAQIMPWTDSQLEAGTPVWERAIEKAIENAAALVVILSPPAKQSDWVARELSYADDHGVRIFPVLIEGDTRSAVPFRLSSTQRVDATGDFDAAMQQLVAALHAHLG